MICRLTDMRTSHQLRTFTKLRPSLLLAVRLPDMSDDRVPTIWTILYKILKDKGHLNRYKVQLSIKLTYAAWGLNSFLCWPLERWGGEPPGGHEGVTDESHLVHCKLRIELVKFEDQKWRRKSLCQSLRSLKHKVNLWIDCARCLNFLPKLANLEKESC